MPHPLETLNPARDIAHLDEELLLSDLSKIENRLERLEVSLKKGKALPTFAEDKKEYEILTRLHPHVEQGIPLRDLDLTTDEEKQLRGFQFLSIKPVLLVLNLGDEGGDAPQIVYNHQKSAITAISGRLEMDIAQLEDEDDQAMFMEEYDLTELSSERVIRQGYNLLRRMNFFTVGEDEVKAWEVSQDATALECAGAIHSDLARGFIRAEVVSYDHLMAAGSNTAAKAQGNVRLEGKEHPIEDGDVVVIRFNI